MKKTLLLVLWLGTFPIALIAEDASTDFYFPDPAVGEPAVAETYVAAPDVLEATGADTSTNLVSLDPPATAETYVDILVAEPTFYCRTIVRYRCFGAPEDLIYRRDYGGYHMAPDAPSAQELAEDEVRALRSELETFCTAAFPDDRGLFTTSWEYPTCGQVSL